MFTEFTENQRRELGRRHADAAEVWLRKIVHVQMSQAYGDGYFFDPVTTTGQHLVSKEIREHARERMKADPGRFARPIDATTFGHVVKLALHPQLYAHHFKVALAAAYPDGEAEARTFLLRIENIRNKLAHGGTCSVRDLERVICYSNDLVESLKDFFVSQNKQRLYNVPMITKLIDSRGNEFYPPSDRTDFTAWFPRDQGVGDLEIGEVFSIEVEVDPTFDPASYKVQWTTFTPPRPPKQGTRFQLTISEEYVTERFILHCDVISDKPWHRLGASDDLVIIHYRILPPP
jgi:hypothetical protein